MPEEGWEMFYGEHWDLEIKLILSHLWESRRREGNVYGKHWDPEIHWWILSQLLECQKKGKKCLWGALRSREIVNSQSLVGMPEEGWEMFYGEHWDLEIKLILSHLWESRRRVENVYGKHWDPEIHWWILSQLLGCQEKGEKCLWGALRSRDIVNSQQLLGCQKKGEKCLWGPLRSRDPVNSQSLVGMPEEGLEMFMGSTEIQRSSKFSINCWDARSVIRRGKKTSATLPLIKICRMSLISAWSILLESTFNSYVKKCGKKCTIIFFCSMFCLLI
jgi:hypothetical protein